MGLTNGVHWAAWYTVSIILISPSIFLLCIIFKYGKVLQASDPSVIALMLYAFSFATTTQGKVLVSCRTIILVKTFVFQPGSPVLLVTGCLTIT